MSLSSGARIHADMIPYGAQTMDQSSFALGSMTWNVVLLQGDGSIQNQAETWTAPEIALLQDRIGNAATHWEGLTSGFHENARLSIDVNYINGGNPMLTGYEPTTDTSEIWVNDVMGQMGYNSSSRFSNVRNFNQDSRVAAETHWSTTVFVMDNTSAALSSYAYARHGGPYTVLTYNAAGWQPDNFNMVLAHEMGHIFFAHDEYAASGRRVTDRGGYLNVENGNASRDANGNVIAPPQPNALMRNNGNFSTHVPYDPSSFSSAMFGHRDSDGDGVPDILDTTPTLTGDASGSNSATGEFVFNGSLSVNPLTNQNPLNVGFSNSVSDMTINTIDSAYYTVDGGGPIMIDSQDGLFDNYTESFGFSISGLTGNHMIDVYGLNSVDNSSNMLSFNFIASVPEPSAFFALSLLSSTLMFRRRRR